MTYTEAETWINGLELLTLDFARPVYAELGVGITCEETLRGLTRDMFLGRFSGHDRAFESDDLVDPVGMYSIWVEPYLSVLEQAMGSDNRNRVERWVKYVACSEKSNPWTIYEDVMSSWSSIWRKSGIDRFGFSADASIIAQEIMSALDLSATKDLLNERKNQPLTDWDLPRFQRLGLLEVPKDSDFFPFSDALMLAIGMNRFQNAWRRICSFLGPRDIDLIASQTEELAAKLNAHYCRPGDLLQEFESFGSFGGQEAVN